MSHKRIVYTRPDGGISIVVPSDKFIKELMSDRKLSEQEAINYIVQKDVPVKLTQDSVIDEISFNSGQLVPRRECEKHGITYEDIPFSIINDTDLPNADGSKVIEEYVLDEKTREVKKCKCENQIRAFRNCWRWDGEKIICDPELEKKERWNRIRTIRNKLLDMSDKEMSRAMETQIGISEIKEYRQKLRDIPQNNTDPENIDWPIKP